MKGQSNFAVCRRLAALIKPLAGFMVLAVLMGTAGHLCAASITVFGGYALLSLLHFEVPLNLNAAFVCLGVSAVLRGVLRYGEQTCNHFIAFRLLALIRDRVFRALRRLCPAKLEGKDRGDLISVITSDVELLEVFYAHTVSPVAIALMMSLILCGFIGRYHFLLGLLAAAAYFTVGAVTPLRVSRKSGDSAMRVRAGSGALSGELLDSLRGLSETIQYHAGEERLAEMNARTETLATEESIMKKRSGRNMAVTNTVVLLFGMVMLFLSAAMYRSGRIGFDGVLIPTVALMSSLGPVIALANLGGTLQNPLAAGRRVLDILNDPPKAEEVKGKPEIVFSGAETEHVAFSYGEETILSNVSVKIPEHSVVGIVGRSGSGKSTLLRLLMRFWDTGEGCVKLSETDIRQINTDNLREMESLVTQETHLFCDSIRNNLRIAKRDASQAEIEEACRKASVHDFIMKLPRGYDTPVGELGDTLSGGERQRLGLARAFLHDAPFLLLDEPTSNLDSLNEAVILKSLDEQRNGKTVVLVSHRPSTMRIADAVYSVENGRVS